MCAIRFELKDIADGMRSLRPEEIAAPRRLLKSRIGLRSMGDVTSPDRKLLTPMEGIATRLLEGTLGIEGAQFGSWSEAHFDRFFQQHLGSGCYLWIDADGTGPEPLFLAPYSAPRRDWLYVSALEAGMRPCGITREDGRLSVMANLDCDFTFVFGEAELMAKFDSAFGGIDRICAEFNAFLTSKAVDFGAGDIYGFMKTCLPAIGGCGERG